MDCSTPGFLSITTSCSLLKLMSIEPVKPPNHLILCCSLLLPPLIFPSVRVQFSKESALRIRWSKYWIFSFSLSPSNEYSGLISFRMDWLDLLAVQRTHKSLLQHHNSKASVLQCSAFFMVQLSHLYMTTGKTTALTRRTFVGKVSNWKGPWGHSVSWEGTWVWTDSGRWWRTGKPGALQSMGSQRVKRDLTTEQQQANRIFHVPDSCEEQTTTSKCCGFC